MIKENAKPIPLDMSMKIPKMKGHTTIILKDEKTGEIERHEDDNYMTNAIAEYFANCGFMNYPNIDRSNMVELLLGGVMAFDEPISENNDDPTIVHVPAGHKMIANGSVGTLNNGEVLEMGSYSSTESGWQADGSYVQTYDFTTSQANGTISCVCLTGQAYGYAGEGNSISGVAHTTRVNVRTLEGSISGVSGITGIPFNIDFTNSTCHTFALETRTNEQTEEDYNTIVLRCYRLPISMLNIKGTMSAPIMLSEQEVAISAEDWSILAAVPDSYGRRMYSYQSFGQNLLIWNTEYNASKNWGSGSYTQYLWTLTPSGQFTRQTVINTMGEDLCGLQVAFFDGDYCIFFDVAGSDGYGWNTQTSDTKHIRVWKRSTGQMYTIENPYGHEWSRNNAWSSGNAPYQYGGFWLLHRSGDGRITLISSFNNNSGCVVIDAVNRTCYPTNASSSGIATWTSYEPCQMIDGLIRNNGLSLYRDQSYIASINNLETPVVKTAEKSMKIIYRITFEEEEE